MMDDEIGVDVVVENTEGSVDIKSDVLKGDKGDPTATIEINSVITGEAGTDASINNIGTDNNLKLNIVIPRGDKGDKGDQGEQGEQGIQGLKGDKGDKGDTGEQGIQGVQGIQGEQGEPGIQGQKGDKGDTGAKGEDGYTPIKGTDYFTEAEIEQIKNDILIDVSYFDTLIVTELPTENIQEKVLYLIAIDGTTDKYNAYIYADNGWRCISSAQTGDSLPIGTIVEYDGITVPDGYEEVEENEIVVSATEPTGNNRKKVWMQKSNNANKIYVKNDNDVYEEFMKKEKSILKVGLNANYNIPVSQTNNTIPLNTEFLHKGEAFTLKNNSIVIGKGINIVRITGQLILSDFKTKDIRALRVYKNGESAVYYPKILGTLSANGDANFEGFNCSSIINVSEGDTLQLAFQGFNTDIIRGIEPATFLLVEEI